VRLIERLESLLAEEQSLFRAQLLREDLARLHRLQELAQSAPDLAAFKRSGMRIGWTQGEARTHELRGELERLLEAFHSGDEDAVERAWEALHRARMEKLVGCLSTPVPKPD
jgi:hypothetical protein